jgi:hypothetical protein
MLLIWLRRLWWWYRYTRNDMYVSAQWIRQSRWKGEKLDDF